MATTLRDHEGNIICQREEPNLTPPGGGEPFDGLYPNFDPVAELEADDEEHGIVHYLDITEPLDQLIIDKPVENLKQITFSIRSISDSQSGDITLIPSVDGEDQAALTLAVGVAWEKVTIPMNVTAGAVVLRRDASASDDTLSVAAVVRNVTTWSTK